MNGWMAKTSSGWLLGKGPSLPLDSQMPQISSPGGTIRGESPVPKGAAASSSIPQRDSRGGVAPGLARKYKLDLMEVRGAL